MNDEKSHGGRAIANAIEDAYRCGANDYYMEPLVGEKEGQPVGCIKDGDSVVFCCRRGEREVELTEMFTEKEFDAVPRRPLNDLYFAMLTLYNEKFIDLPVAFGPQHSGKSLAQVLSENGKTQFHCAESEKYAHVTFFLNGGVNTPYENETDICVPTIKGVPYEKIPALSLADVSKKVCEAIGNYDFIVTNFANGDVIGHLDDADAKIPACNNVDMYLKEVVEMALSKDYVVLVTADHGNIETLYTADKKPHNAHTCNLVGCIMLDGRKSEAIKLNDGALCDVTPTILHAMKLPQPEEMTGKSLTQEDFGDDRKVMLVILDGWGIGTYDDNDAIYLAETPYWDTLMNQQHGVLKASGAAVGLSEGKPGNSEAGHSNLGAGRVVDQDDVRLDKAIKDGSFGQSKAFIDAIQRAIDNKKALHLIAYLSYKSSHGSIDYAIEVARLAKKMGLNEVYFHLITDGRSTVPFSAPELVMELEEQLDEIGIGMIADAAGRGLILDRDKNYDRVKRAYDAMVDGIGKRYTV